MAEKRTSVRIQTGDRETLIAFGHTLGIFFKENPQGKPWIVCLDGNLSSGKELIALAVHQILSPQDFSETISADVSANALLSPSHWPPKNTVFFDVFGMGLKTQESMDEWLHSLNDIYKFSQVILASNFSKTLEEPGLRSVYDLEARGVDISIQVFKDDETFQRRLIVNTRNGGLQRILAGFNGGQPAAPATPAPDV